LIMLTTEAILRDYHRLETSRDLDPYSIRSGMQNMFFWEKPHMARMNTIHGAQLSVRDLSGKKDFHLLPLKQIGLIATGSTVL
jgi:hypothetical protein